VLLVAFADDIETVVVKGFETADSREINFFDVTFVVVMVTAAVAADVVDELLVVCVFTFFFTPSLIGLLLFDNASFDNDVIADLVDTPELDGAPGRCLSAVNSARNPLDSPLASDAKMTRT
jgi:hypothetical protein